MLVLSRKVGEAIVIAGTIRVTVVVVAGDRVRLGVQAPPEVRVDREEAHLRRGTDGLTPPMLAPGTAT
jgi:carbon storage regulator